jgi:NAD(P)-dependent dehydrogenase (short-subunit alcohol dehydrogenase family)
MQKWTPADIPSLHGKVAIVTGANSGIGFGTALELARHGASVVLGCRSAAKAQGAMDKLHAAVPDARAEVIPLDLADLKSVTVFAQAFNGRFGQLDILHNNAGVIAAPRAYTAQKIEMQLGTNHLGHFALTAQLWPRLSGTPGARIVTTASLGHKIASSIPFDDLNYEHHYYWKWMAYGRSKLANLLFTYELDRRLRARQADAIAVAAHPGFSATPGSLTVLGPAVEKLGLGDLVVKFANAVITQPSEAGAYPQLYASTMPGIGGGEYFGPDGFGEFRGHPTRVRSNRASYDATMAQRLWQVSEQLAGVKFLSD